MAASQRLAGQARQLVQAEFTRTVLQLALQYGIRSIPRLNDPDFVSSLVFDATKPTGTPKARFAYLFPNSRSALVQVRLRPTLTDAQRTRTISLIRQAVRMPAWHLDEGESYVVTGVPVILSDLLSKITHSILVLLVAALLVMAGTLTLVFRSRLRLLPLAIALVAAALTFGALSLAGASLTMASIGVLPVLIGLAVDYAIQFQSRFNESLRSFGGEPSGAGAPVAALTRAAAVGAPTIATAAAATAGGLAVLALSPVPMVRGFGLLLVAGIVISFGCALIAGSALLGLSGSRGRSGVVLARAETLGAAIASAWRGAGELLASVPGVRRLAAGTRRLGQVLTRFSSRALATATREPARVLAVGVALAVVGWGLDTQVRVESDIQKLVPQNLQALRDLGSLERSTGVGGEIDVMVSADDLTRPDVVSWMTGYQAALLKHFGYSVNRGCGKAQLCPAFSLPDLLRTQGANPSQASIRALLAAVPPYFSQGVITPDHRVATLAFGIRLMPLDRQQSVIDFMRSQLHPPPGVRTDLVGLPVLAAEANNGISSSWRRLWTQLAGLIAVALVLLAALRRPRRALVPLIPIVMATGWSSLVLFATRVPLNPMSVTLGALVIAISTEFSVLLSERYHQERAAGYGSAEALTRTYRYTGAAVLASGATAIAGFAVLIVSDIRMLRDFGLVTVVDLTVALLGVMIALPAVLVLAEQGELLSAPTRALQRALRLGRSSAPAEPERSPAT